MLARIMPHQQADQATILAPHVQMYVQMHVQMHVFCMKESLREKKEQLAAELTNTNQLEPSCY